ncbi:aminotransferase class IV [Kitasatospora sp. RB6PN24]|uniref:aminotransferase class IV n=1 Tax=Kitasatospora humi TaxID=2893891 RepID=UPI001E462D4D|nr:aminotransferase class IV [Kitasatospora humi]MCC9307587.1 aminotransferase class IV [Kitasatospora humi]
MMILDGRPVTADALAPLALTPYGHFTTLRTDDGRTVRGLGLHLARLAADCRALFGVELDTGLVRDRLRQALAAETAPVIARVTVYDPAFDLGRPADARDPRILVSTRAAGEPSALAPLRVCSAVHRRVDPAVKHVGLYDSLRLRRDAQLRGWDDVLFTDPDGLVGEGATWNLGLVRGGRLVWPRAEVLMGVTMRLLTGLHADHGDEPVHRDELGGYDAAFACNTAIGVRPLTAVDGHRFPPAHPVLDRLRAAYWASEGEEV